MDGPLPFFYYDILARIVPGAVTLSVLWQLRGFRPVDWLKNFVQLGDKDGWEKLIAPCDWCSRPGHGLRYTGGCTRFGLQSALVFHDRILCSPNAYQRDLRRHPKSMGSSISFGNHFSGMVLRGRRQFGGLKTLPRIGQIRYSDTRWSSTVERVPPSGSRAASPSRRCPSSFPCRSSTA